MRVSSWVFAGIFALGAIVQWNDPDPALWVLGYTIGAALSLMSALGRRDFFANAIACIVYGAWFMSIASSLWGAPQEAFTSFTMQASAHEQPREAVGLALLTCWTGVLAMRARVQTAR